MTARWRRLTQIDNLNDGKLGVKGDSPVNDREGGDNDNDKGGFKTQTRLELQVRFFFPLFFYFISTNIYT